MDLLNRTWNLGGQLSGVNEDNRIQTLAIADRTDTLALVNREHRK